MIMKSFKEMISEASDQSVPSEILELMGNSYDIGSLPRVFDGTQIIEKGYQPKIAKLLGWTFIGGRSKTYGINCKVTIMDKSVVLDFNTIYNGTSKDRFALRPIRIAGRVKLIWKNGKVTGIEDKMIFGFVEFAYKQKTDGMSLADAKKEISTQIKNNPSMI